MKLFAIIFSRMRPAIETAHAQSREIKNFVDQNFRDACLILENSEKFMPWKFWAIRYSLTKEATKKNGK